MDVKRIVLFANAFLCLAFQSKAQHILGGELTYRCLQNSTYLIELRVYRDCSLPATVAEQKFDEKMFVAAYDSDNNLLVNLALPKSHDSTLLEFNPGNACMADTPNICALSMLYSGIHTFNSIPTGGIHLVSQRCCRVAGVANLSVSSMQGTTFYAHIPEANTVLCNSSPVWSMPPSFAMCKDVEVELDFSATDPDNDSLVYGLCNPFKGGDPIHFKVPEPPMPPPFQQVIWASPYNQTYQMGGSPPMDLDYNTGVMAGTPTVSGGFATCVSVKEYRNGVYLGEVRRDFQLQVEQCDLNAMAAVDSISDACSGLSVEFNGPRSIGEMFYWHFGDQLSGQDTNIDPQASYTFPDTGTYIVRMVSEGELCNDTTQIEVHVKPKLSIDVQVPEPQCFAGHSFNLKAGGEYYVTSEIAWDFGMGSKTPIVHGKEAKGVVFNEPGEYVMTASVEDFGCTKSVGRTLTVLPDPEVAPITPEFSGCTPFEFNFSPHVTGFLNPVYKWSTPSGAMDQPSYMESFSEPGRYDVSFSVIEDSTCADTFSYEFSVLAYQSPTAGFFVSPSLQKLYSPDFEVVNQAMDYQSSVFYIGDDTVKLDSFLYSFENSGTYEILQVVEGDNGCIDSLSRTVSVEPAYIFYAPSAFTPDGDGVNDLWFPVMHDAAEFKLSIYNRWGDLIFETDNPLVGWDGKMNNNRPAPEDVYPFKVRVTDSWEKVWDYDGTLTLLR